MFGKKPATYFTAPTSRQICLGDLGLGILRIAELYHSFGSMHGSPSMLMVILCPMYLTSSLKSLHFLGLTFSPLLARACRTETRCCLWDALLELNNMMSSW